MRVWLASYPRSGNTLLRIVLRNVFDLTSTSLYPGEIVGFDKFANVSAIVGHYEEPAGIDQPQHRSELPEQGLQLVKTHGYPTDDHPAIYVVRDGRMAIISYFHFLTALARVETTIGDIIAGRLWPGSWSAHYRQWKPCERGNTLFLRFEELRDENSKACQKIGEFLKREPIRPLNISFSNLQRLNPEFFRTADDNKSLSEMRPHMDAFLEHHGAVMRELGYI
jgi:Sulfotransferase domain